MSKHTRPERARLFGGAEVAAPRLEQRLQPGGDVVLDDERLLARADRAVVERLRVEDRLRRQRQVGRPVHVHRHVARADAERGRARLLRQLRRCCWCPWRGSARGPGGASGARRSPSGPASSSGWRPAARRPLSAASARMRTVSFTHFRAPRCALMISGLRVFMQMSALKIAVEVGLVIGTVARIGPLGCAISVMPRSWSCAISPTVRVWRMSS